MSTSPHADTRAGISGLILLVERPIKVGDWVVLNEFEGDVRSIKARATEIQKLDRSTIIVPNSEFITKVVRNITYANPLGRVQIKLPMPLGTDVERVRTELLETFQAHPEILRKPAPQVVLEGIEGGSILFIARGFVISPRSVEDVLNAVLFDALVRLNAAGITLARTTAVVMKQSGPVDERTYDGAWIQSLRLLQCDSGSFCEP